MPASVLPGNRVEVCLAADGDKTLRARVQVEAGEVLVPFRVLELLPSPVRHSIQLGPSAHALVEPEALRLTNHSCSPNVVVDTRAAALAGYELAEHIRVLLQARAAAAVPLPSPAVPLPAGSGEARGLAGGEAP